MSVTASVLAIQIPATESVADCRCCCPCRGISSPHGYYTQCVVELLEDGVATQVHTLNRLADRCEWRSADGHWRIAPGTSSITRTVPFTSSAEYDPHFGESPQLLWLPTALVEAPVVSSVNAYVGTPPRLRLGYEQPAGVVYRYLGDEFGVDIRTPLTVGWTGRRFGEDGTVPRTHAMRLPPAVQAAFQASGQPTPPPRDWGRLGVPVNGTPSVVEVRHRWAGEWVCCSSCCPQAATIGRLVQVYTTAGAYVGAPRPFDPLDLGLGCVPYREYTDSFQAWAIESGQSQLPNNGYVFFLWRVPGFTSVYSLTRSLAGGGTATERGQLKATWVECDPLRVGLLNVSILEADGIVRLRNVFVEGPTATSGGAGDDCWREGLGGVEGSP